MRICSRAIGTMTSGTATATKRPATTRQRRTNSAWSRTSRPAPTPSATSTRASGSGPVAEDRHDLPRAPPQPPMERDVHARTLWAALRRQLLPLRRRPGGGGVPAGPQAREPERQQRARCRSRRVSCPAVWLSARRSAARPAARRAGPRVDAARRHHGIGSHAMSDDATLMRQLRTVRRAAIQAREEAKLAYQFVPNSYTYGALAQIELILVRLQEIEP